LAQENKQLIGTLFERLFSKLFGAKEVPGSGNQPFRKMDTESGAFILWSLKATNKKSFSITRKDLDEVYEAVRGLGGVGSDTVAGLAICFVEGDEPKPTDKIVAVIDIHDYVAQLEQKPEIFKPDKSTSKYARAAIPQLFRQDA